MRRVHGEETHQNNAQQDKQELVVAFCARIMLVGALAVLVVDLSCRLAAAMMTVLREFFEQNFRERYVDEGACSDALYHLSC